MKLKVYGYMFVNTSDPFMPVRMFVCVHYNLFPFVHFLALSNLFSLTIFGSALN